MAKIYIGTSGWSYAHWKGVFYPDKVSGTKMLPFYAEHFPTVELNASFYRLPKAATFDGWRERTPEGFVFAVKASKLITHNKRLVDVNEPWELFITNVSRLGNKLGPILFQLPPSLKADIGVLDELFKMLPEQYSYVIEPRNDSFFEDQIVEALRKHQVCLCIPDSPRFPQKLIVTAPFVYVRLHGSSRLYGSKYTDEELAAWAKKVDQWHRSDLDVYVYFNNDYMCYAVENAKTLMRLLDIHVQD